MVVTRRPLILLIDLGGGAALAALLSCLVFLIILPFQQRHADAPQVQRELAEGSARLEKLAKRTPFLAERLQALETSLKDTHAQPLADPSAFLARLAVQCEQLGIELQHVQPSPVRRIGEHQRWDVQVRVHGPFPQLARLLHDMESWSPFLDIATAQLQGPAPGASATCEMSFTAGIRFLAEKPPARKGGGS